MGDAQWKGRVYAITGGASGMALDTARLLTSRGAIVSLADLNADGLKDAIKTLTGDKNIYTALDVRDGAAVDQWIEKTVQTFGRLDGAVNFAGICPFSKHITEETEEDFRRVMDINLMGIFHCLKAQLRRMKAGASIVNAASVDSYIGWPKLSGYCASKHAVLGLSRTAAKENPTIRVNCVAPGNVDTGLLAGADTETAEELSYAIQKRFAKTSEISPIVAFLLSDEASYVTGASWNCDVLSSNIPTQVIARDFAIPKVYLVCEKDKVIPVNHQHEMAQAADARIVTIASGHSPQLDEKHSRAIAGTVKQFFV